MHQHIRKCSKAHTPNDRPRALCALGTVAVLLIGCSEAQQGGRDDLAWSLDSLVAIGAPGQSVEFERVSSVLRGPGGEILVADAKAKRILEFDSSGTWRREIGRQGAGPGEFGIPSSIGFLGDTLAVLDNGNGRIGFFTAAGDWAGSVPASRISGPEVRLIRVPLDGLYTYGVHMRSGERPRRAYVRLTSTGYPDTVAMALTSVPQGSSVTCEGSDKGLRFFTTPWPVRLLDAPGPGGTLLTAVNDRYEIAQLGRTGDTLLLYRGQSTPVPVTDAEWEGVGRELREYLAADPGAGCDSPALQRPKTKPILRAFFFGTDGLFWVERYTASGFAFDVFDTNGVLVGSMAAPERLVNVEPHATADRLLLVAETPEGIPVVRAYGVRRGHKP